MLSDREKYLIALLISIIVIYTYYYYVLSPLQGTINTIQEENYRLQDNYLVQQKLMLDDTSLDQDKVREELQSLLNQVPATPCIPEAIACLEETAQKSRVMLLGVNYQKPVVGSITDTTNVSQGYECEDIEVQIKGHYKDIRYFVDQIESKTSRIYILSNSRLQAPNHTVDWSRVASSDSSGSSIYNDSNIRASINITIIYDGINMPGVQDDINNDSARSLNH